MGRIGSKPPSRLPRPEPTKGLGRRMVVDAKTPRDSGDASAAVEHAGADAGDDLVDRDHERVCKTDVSDKTTEG